MSTYENEIHIFMNKYKLEIIINLYISKKTYLDFLLNPQKMYKIALVIASNL